MRCSAPARSGSRPPRWRPALRAGRSSTPGSRCAGGRLALPGVGTVVSCATAPATAGASGTVALLLGHYGAGPVRGEAGSLSAAAFQLPVSAEPSAARLRPPFAAPLAELASGQHTLAPPSWPPAPGWRCGCWCRWPSMR